VKQFDFKTQLTKGEAGETLFLKYHPDLTRLDGRKGDFIGFTKRKIELKTDSRSTRETANFFMEYTRNESTGAPGGPWQSAASKVHYFVYLFSDGFIYWFETTALVAHLEAHKEKYKTRRIFNKGWTAVGWLVPRASLEEVIIKKENMLERNCSKCGHLPKL
jgi:hypothetical protein